MPAKTISIGQGNLQLNFRQRISIANAPICCFLYQQQMFFAPLNVALHQTPSNHRQKAGVQLSDFVPLHAQKQFDLFTEEEYSNNVALMDVMDQVNKRFPKSLTVAATGLSSSLGSVNDFVSPRYTTSWQDLPRVKC